MIVDRELFCDDGQGGRRDAEVLRQPASKERFLGRRLRHRLLQEPLEGDPEVTRRLSSIGHDSLPSIANFLILTGAGYPGAAPA